MLNLLHPITHLLCTPSDNTTFRRPRLSKHNSDRTTIVDLDANRPWNETLNETFKFFLGCCNFSMSAIDLYRDASGGLSINK